MNGKNNARTTTRSQGLVVSKSAYILGRERPNGSIEIYTEDGKIPTYRTREEAWHFAGIAKLAVLPTNGYGDPYPTDTELWRPYRMRVSRTNDFPPVLGL